MPKTDCSFSLVTEMFVVQDDWISFMRDPFDMFHII